MDAGVYQRSRILPLPSDNDHKSDQCKLSLLFAKILSGNNPNQASFSPLFLPHASEVRLVPDLHNPRRFAVHLGLHLLHVLGHLVHELRLVRPEDADGEERRVGRVIDANRRDGNTALEVVSKPNSRNSLIQGK